MNKSERLAFFITLLICAVASLSFRWPLDEGRITSSFGESRADHFHDGIDMVCPDDKIYPVDKGKLVYYWDESIFPLDTIPGGGNFRVLLHEKGIYSIYMHLKGGAREMSSYGKKDLIGTIGNSGHSYARHLHFSMLKKSERASLNPMGLLPSWPDKKAPEIKGFLLHIGERYITLKENGEIRLTRHYPLLVSIADTITGKERLGIHRLIVAHNGKEIFNTEFKDIRFSPEGLQVGNRPFEGIFDPKGYYRITGVRYSTGSNSFSVKAVDFAGNVSEKIFTCTVNLDME